MVYMDTLDRNILDALQDGIAICDRPFAALAEALSISERVLLARIQRMLDDGVLTRFGPMYQAERLGGALTLCAMRVPEAHFEEVADIVNGFTEVAHNYRREHAFNMWFVLATETPQEIDTTLVAIEAATGYQVFNMPKLEEFYVQLRLSA
jgi:DNA-binding Lrp family transcriptional regulator